MWKKNILIAYICSKILKLPEKNFIHVIKNFKGLPYRSSIIFKNKNLKVINNSKSTNINSTINSIKNYSKIYLILGGIAKEKNFEILLKYQKRVICVYTFGLFSVIGMNMEILIFLSYIIWKHSHLCSISSLSLN